MCLHFAIQPRYILAAFALLITFAPQANADPLYRVTDLGERYPTGLNNAGQVVGDSFLFESLGSNAGGLIDLSGVAKGTRIYESMTRAR